MELYTEQFSAIQIFKANQFFRADLNAFTVNDLTAHKFQSIRKNKSQ